jgi:hypothetical protein
MTPLSLRGPNHDFTDDEAVTIGGITLYGANLGKRVRDRFLALVDLILHDHGEQAFEMPKRAAAIHEAGHVVINAVLGVKTISAQIESRPVKVKFAWGGWTEAPDIEFVDTPDSPPSYELLLNRARFTYAGIAAEDLFANEDRRPGSSLDEIMGSQLACEIAAMRLEHGDAERIWRNDVHAWCIRQLDYNRAVHAEIANALAKHGRVDGKPLREMCAKVRQMKADN